MKTPNSFDVVFKIVMSIAAFSCVYILQGFDNSLNKMQESVNRLNVSFAEISERLVTQNFRYDTIEKRTKWLEDTINERTKDRWTKTDQMLYASEMRDKIDEIKGMIKDNHTN